MTDVQVAVGVWWAVVESEWLARLSLGLVAQAVVNTDGVPTV